MTEETPMRERIARVIYDALEGPINNADAARQMRQWELSLRIANAVLDAMREPTPSLLQALSREWESEGRRTMLDNWRAAIDAAKEGK